MCNCTGNNYYYISVIIPEDILCNDYIFNIPAAFGGGDIGVFYFG